LRATAERSRTATRPSRSIPIGNPYNDIGAYLIEQEKWTTPSLVRKAMVAKRYEARCYPYSTSARLRAPAQMGESQEVLWQAYAMDERYITA